MPRLLRRPALVLVVVVAGVMLVGVHGPAMASSSGMAAAGGVAAQADFDGVCRDALMPRAYEPIAHAWSSGAEVPFSQCVVVYLSTANQHPALPTFALLTGFGRAVE